MGAVDSDASGSISWGEFLASILLTQVDKRVPVWVTPMQADAHSYAVYIAGGRAESPEEETLAGGDFAEKHRNTAGRKMNSM